ncbi:hypothetical protein SAMN05421780_101569 [Flexibacter flexilis DSM 6793]|uniref:Uncharacterized protein n=1 Tax=Flexibacter flexilis DSM 6793 TaxID=927664 RepID=A0A1I1E158_9BACT|nr:hypothetical protein [Flexibacter flexilis]SFB80804.1 hypothetical protein SAMN05421780_101569 [Flexibacter flexilis DSM 6793]
MEIKLTPETYTCMFSNAKGQQICALLLSKAANSITVKHRDGTLELILITNNELVSLRNAINKILDEPQPYAKLELTNEELGLACNVFQRYEAEPNEQKDWLSICDKIDYELLRHLKDEK